MSRPLFGVSEATARDLWRAFEETPALERVWIFGSRARGTARDVSDIDLAVDAPALPAAGFEALHRRLLDLPTLYKLDVVHWQKVSDPMFVQEIQRDRQVFWQPARPTVGIRAVEETR
jgi:predicted nucleotidyltransferase